ncbi:isochorismatase family protein [Streptomyces sp. NPDC058611]|uniref:isochorismatase family protein n=1 Tax=unclassified Streptomyces TaxID=2593676 RepID=UPI0036619381
MVFVDHQPQMFFGVASADRAGIINAPIGLAKAARAFDVPAVLTTVAAASFSGPILPQLADVFPGQTPVDRTSMNAWEDEAPVAAVKATGRKKIILSGLWTEVCLVLPALSALLAQGYEVYVAPRPVGAERRVRVPAVPRRHGRRARGHRPRPLVPRRRRRPRPVPPVVGACGGRHGPGERTVDPAGPPPAHPRPVLDEADKRTSTRHFLRELNPFA